MSDEFFLFTRGGQPTPPPTGSNFPPSKSPEAKSVLVVQPGFISGGPASGKGQSIYLMQEEESPPYKEDQPEPEPAPVPFNQRQAAAYLAQNYGQAADLRPPEPIDLRPPEPNDLDYKAYAGPIEDKVAVDNEQKICESSDSDKKYEKKSEPDKTEERSDDNVAEPQKVQVKRKKQHDHRATESKKEKRAPVKGVLKSTKEKRPSRDNIKTARQKRKKQLDVAPPPETYKEQSAAYFTKREKRQPEKKTLMGSIFRRQAPSASVVPASSAPEDVRFKAMITDEDGLNSKAMHMTRVRGGGYRPLSKETYFHGLMPRDDIEKMLRRNGDFLCREAQIQNRRIEAISVRWNDKVQHFIVATTKKGRYHMGLHTFDCVADLIDWYSNSGQPLSADTGVVLKHKVHRRSWQLDPDQIRLHEKLGEGAFGEVFKGILVEGVRTTQVAVKRQSNLTSEDVKSKTREFLNEFKTMREFKHPNVVRVYGVAAQVDPILIVMEYLPGGSLQKYLRTQGIHIRLPNRIQFCTEAAAGMRYLEKKKVLHRDIATRNCLMGPRQEIKISDFGLSLFDAKEFKEEKGKKVPIKWLAPETLRTGIYSPATDVWSFGVLMWEIFADGADPYPRLSNAQVRQKVTGSCYRMKPAMGTPTEVAQLMEKKCWEEVPNRRPSFRHIHNFFTSIGKYYGLPS